MSVAAGLVGIGAGAKADMIYLIHPESCCAWKVATREEADKALASDHLVEEISYDEYLRACDAYGEDPNE